MAAEQRKMDKFRDIKLGFSFDTLRSVGNVVHGVNRLHDNRIYAQSKLQLVLKSSSPGGFDPVAPHKNPGPWLSFPTEGIAFTVDGFRWELDLKGWWLLILYHLESPCFTKEPFNAFLKGTDLPEVGRFFQVAMGEACR